MITLLHRTVRYLFFYKNLCFFPKEYDVHVHLSKAEETSCEGPLTETECVSSLKQVDDSKTPGTDGLPAEFY